MAPVWRRYGAGMAPVWRRYGARMAPVWRPAEPRSCALRARCVARQCGARAAHLPALLAAWARRRAAAARRAFALPVHPLRQGARRAARRADPPQARDGAPAGAARAGRNRRHLHERQHDGQAQG
eukprot:5959427-Prymnesium_polylepis.1